MRYWEDFTVGHEEYFGSYRVTEDEIIEFAREFDPLPFHTDAIAADAGPFGGLIAPGLLICSIYMRLLVDHVLAHATSMGSPGVESVRWTAPVRPGDTLHVVHRILESRRLNSRPDIGLVKTDNHIFNQDDVEVMHIVSHGMFAVREAAT